jgi:hypothetical protein
MTLAQLLTAAVWFLMAYAFRPGSIICEEHAKRWRVGTTKQQIWRHTGMLLWVGVVLCVISLSWIVLGESAAFFTAWCIPLRQPNDSSPKLTPLISPKIPPRRRGVYRGGIPIVRKTSDSADFLDQPLASSIEVGRLPSPEFFHLCYLGA